MDPAGAVQGARGGASPGAQRPCRAYGWGWSCSALDRQEARVCRYFQKGFCFRGDPCSYQHPGTLSLPEWGHRHSEPHVAPWGPGLGQTSPSYQPASLPWPVLGVAGAPPGLVGLASLTQGLGSSCWESLCLSAAGRHPHGSRGPQPQPGPAQELTARHLDPEGRPQDSRDVVCGICMDRVWDKPGAQRVFGILPNCAHAHCLGCLRAWRSSRPAFQPQVIKACPQCRVYSSYIIPHKFWVGEGAAKEQLIRSFRARTSQTRCRFFLQRNGRCPFQADCIYLHQLPAAARASGPPWSGGVQLASGSEMVLSPASFLAATDCALALARWGSQLLLDPGSSSLRPL